MTDGPAPDLQGRGVTDSFTNPAGCVLSLHGIAKTFGGARALKGIALDVRPGEIHGLLGQNGSGKSTLVKILSGFHAPDPGGRMLSNGEAVDLPLKAGAFRRLGLSFVHQNLGLVGSLTVLENLRLAEITLARRPFIDWRAERAAARRALDRFGIDLDPAERIDRLSPVDRALLAIVRAFEEIHRIERATGKPGLVLLDEPTPFLPRQGVEKLFGLMRSIAAHGSSVVFISHDIDEVMEVTDRLTVLRDGEIAGELVTRDASHQAVVEMIVGRRIARSAAARPAKTEAGAPVLRFRGVAGRTLDPIDIDLADGEVLGLTGLIGSGYEELPYLIFGARRPRSGTMTLDTDEAISLTGMSPRRAIDLGLALLPGDRQAASGVDTLSVADNLFLPDMARFFRHGRLGHRAMANEAEALCTRYEVRPNDPSLQLKALSGGNAQKVLIARWMNRKPRLLLLDEPTQGVDVGTRQQISAAIRAAAAQGMSVICASSDAEQLTDICDRVLVLARGRVVAEVTGGSVTKEAITEACYASTSLDLGKTIAADPALPLAS